MNCLRRKRVLPTRRATSSTNQTGLDRSVSRGACHSEGMSVRNSLSSVSPSISDLPTSCRNDARQNLVTTGRNAQLKSDSAASLELVNFQQALRQDVQSTYNPERADQDQFMSRPEASKRVLTALEDGASRFRCDEIRRRSRIESLYARAMDIRNAYRASMMSVQEDYPPLDAQFVSSLDKEKLQDVHLKGLDSRISIAEPTRSRGSKTWRGPADYLAKRMSIFSIDQKVRDNSDHLFAISDKLSLTSTHTGNNPKNADVVNMAIAAAHGPVGPMKKRSLCYARKQSYSYESPLNIHSLRPPTFNAMTQCVQETQPATTQTPSPDSVACSYVTDPSDRTSTTPSQDNSLSYQHLSAWRCQSDMQSKGNSVTPNPRGAEGLIAVKSSPPLIPEERLSPVTSLVTRAVIPQLAAVTSKRVLNTLNQMDYNSLPSLDITDSIGDLVRYEGASRTKRSIDVKVIDTDSGDCQSYRWRGTTLKLCKMLPTTRCYPVHDSMLCACRFPSSSPILYLSSLTSSHDSIKPRYFRMPSLCVA